MPTTRPYTTGQASLDAQIRALVADLAEPHKQALLAEMMTAVYKLGHDQASTGDLKLVNAALKELRYAFKIFKPYRHVPKVALFGSARTPAKEARYRLAVRFAELMVRAGWMIITGAASGLMRAGQEGAGARGSFGLNIRLPFEQEANPIIAKDSKLVNLKYFFTRKLLFLKESKATALFPGGFGTLDEGFESITLAQTGKSEPRPIVLVDVPGGGYWRELTRFFERQMLGGGMVSPEDRSLYRVVESAEAARDEILRFYSTYHSLRFVGSHLVIRLQRRLSDEAVKRLNQEFRDIVASGAIVSQAALPVEVKDQDVPSLPRLVFKFTRQSFGRLRQLVDRINHYGASSGP